MLKGAVHGHLVRQTSEHRGVVTISALTPDLAAFHELWERRYQILSSGPTIEKVAKVNLNDRYFIEFNCCKYDFAIFLVERGILRDDEDIMALRRMDSGRTYPRIYGHLVSKEEWMDHAKENYPKFFEFIVLNICGQI